MLNKNHRIMNLQESKLEELSMSLNPEGDDPKTGTGGENGGAGEDPGKE